MAPAESPGPVSKEQLATIEAAMRSERDFSNALLDGLPGIFHLSDKNLRLRRWNKNLEAVTGYSAAEIAAMTPLDFAPPKDHALVAGRLAAAFRDGAVEGEGALVTKDGTSMPYYFTGLRSMLDGEPCVLGIGIDISRRRAAEAEIAASQKRLALIFDTVGDVVFLLAVEPAEGFRFVSVNPAFLRVTGLQSEQVIGRRFEEVLPPNSQPLVLERYREAIRSRATVRWEEVAAYPTGTLYGEVAVTPAFDAAGRCTHLIGSVHDITAVRRAAEEVRQLNAELELRVAERTALLATANRDLEAFSYSVSHDLRAPLRAIGGFAEIIARRHRAGLPDEAQRYFDHIVTASERMSQLIDALLQYARLGHRQLRVETLSVAGIFAPLRAAFAHRLEASGGRLEIAADLPAVRGDAVLLGQVFTNLLDNALTYHRPGEPPLVRVDAASEPGAVVVRVSDNGIGIPAQYQEKIFHIFQRLHGDHEYPGTGIGLATVKRALEVLGGSARVESTPGAGSTFLVRLPAA